jgi:hypothetical protein
MAAIVAANRIIFAMTITLDAEGEKYVRREIELGHAQTAEEAVAQLLASHALTQDWDDEDKEWLERRFAENDQALARGEYFTPEEARAELARLKAARR